MKQRKIDKFRTISKLDKKKLSNYSELNKISSSIVILTNERKEHIFKNHPEFFDEIIDGLEETINNPNEIRVNNKDKSELNYIRQLDKNNQIEIVKINITNDKHHLENSIISSWIINNKYLKKYNNTTTIIYKKGLK